ncbi:RibD family protein [Amycolatopsis nigrescens]|uniref:RibD family protein n=1 Tax=Amycolatopsis nigrescens TaxID=381445 RepID=UPI000378B354|nr:dihydrofolate reductase family protein [Amycolatopsis nigrescens]
MNRPYVLLSAAMSLDGYLDDTSAKRLLLSNDEDFDRVDEVRASVDAILVGANTIRADDPRLLVRSDRRRRERAERGLPPTPLKVTCTIDGELDPAAKFFSAGETEKLVYAPTGSVPGTAARLGRAATVLAADDPFDLHLVLADLSARGVRRLLVEGGSTMHTLFLTHDVVDELHLVIAPFFVGDHAAPRFVHSGLFPHGPENPLALNETRQLGDVALLRYQRRSTT